MVRRLKDAFDQAAKLPESAQEQLTDQLIEDIQGEIQWDQTLERSQDVLDQMAAKALNQKADGKTRSGGFDQL